MKPEKTRRVMKRLLILSIVISLTFGFSGSAIADKDKDESGKGRGPKQEYHKGKNEGDKGQEPTHEYRSDNYNGAYFHRYGYERLRIPKGHYPPPGECRVWYPDRPAGQQPPPGICDHLRRRIPPGAWLIQHPEEDLDHVHVIVYDDEHPGRINVVGEFEIDSGSFVRVVLDY